MTESKCFCPFLALPTESKAVFSREKKPQNSTKSTYMHKPNATSLYLWSIIASSPVHQNEVNIPKQAFLQKGHPQMCTLFKTLPSKSFAQSVAWKLEKNIDFQELKAPDHTRAGWNCTTLAGSQSISRLWGLHTFSSHSYWNSEPIYFSQIQTIFK